ncbi:MAG: GNAT family N-acetyltransferase [Candidatus Tectomicrobia bacterium]|nr:GNAT family N-acetyltransferase [Candidatus Tectomicrobia bacterium]
MDIQIVPVREEYVEGYRACLDLVARERRYIGLVEAPPLDACHAWIAEYIAKHSPYFVALDKEQVVGWCDIKLTDRPGFTHRGNLGMGVHPNYRGRRIGTRLLSACVEQARRMGIERVELEVYASNTRARHLYETFGFIVEGCKTRARKLNGVYDDIIDMVLILEESKAN